MATAQGHLTVVVGLPPTIFSFEVSLRAAGKVVTSLELRPGSLQALITSTSGSISAPGGSGSGGCGIGGGISAGGVLLGGMGSGGCTSPPPLFLQEEAMKKQKQTANSIIFRYNDSDFISPPHRYGKIAVVRNEGPARKPEPHFLFTSFFTSPAFWIGLQAPIMSRGADEEKLKIIFGIFLFPNMSVKSSRFRKNH